MEALQRLYPIGIQTFSEIREKNYLYIDKTEYVYRMTHFAKYVFLSRPRRFGKSLLTSTLHSYFSGRKDLFQGLAMERLEKEWIEYPVLHFDMSMAKHVDKERLERLLDFMLSDYERTFGLDITAGDANLRLTRLIKCAYEKTGKKVVVLIDEYDVPVAKANNNGYYNEMLDVMKGLMQALKDNPALRFAVVTGCLKIAKESIFTGTNNFVSDTITNSRLNEYFGFVQSEVNELLKAADMTEQAENMKKWYDGYHFGDFDVYCPWDVMNYMLELQRNPKAKPISYWKNTSDNAIIRSFIDYAGSTITKKLETLMAGGCIVQRVDENLTYDYLHSSEDNLWSTLYLTGYLTRAREEDYKGEVPDGMVALMIPNAEINEIFETTVIKWFDDSAKKWNRNALFDAVWRGDSEGISREMNALLRRTISYHDYREDFYHAFLAGIFTGAGYMVDSNKEHGEGRSDVVVYDPINARVAIFEAKYTKTLGNLEKDCDTALQQIDNRMYAKEYEDDYDQILCYGISFFKKRCMVREKLK